MLAVAPWLPLARMHSPSAASAEGVGLTSTPPRSRVPSPAERTSEKAVPWRTLHASTPMTPRGMSTRRAYQASGTSLVNALATAKSQIEPTVSLTEVLCVVITLANTRPSTSNSKRAPNPMMGAIVSLLIRPSYSDVSDPGRLLLLLLRCWSDAHGPGHADANEPHPCHHHHGVVHQGNEVVQSPSARESADAGSLAGGHGLGGDRPRQGQDDH